MDFSDLSFTDTESDVFERPLKKSIIFFLIFDPYIFSIFRGVIASG